MNYFLLSCLSLAMLKLLFLWLFVVGEKHNTKIRTVHPSMVMNAP